MSNKTPNAPNINRAVLDLLPVMEGVCLRNNCASFEDMIEVTHGVILNYLYNSNKKTESVVDKQRDAIIKTSDDILELLSKQGKPRFVELLALFYAIIILTRIHTSE